MAKTEYHKMSQNAINSHFSTFQAQIFFKRMPFNLHSQPDILLSKTTSWPLPLSKITWHQKNVGGCHGAHGCHMRDSNRGSSFPCHASVQECLIIIKRKSILKDSKGRREISPMSILRKLPSHCRSRARVILMLRFTLT